MMNKLTLLFFWLSIFHLQAQDSINVYLKRNPSYRPFTQVKYVMSDNFKNRLALDQKLKARFVIPHFIESFDLYQLKIADYVRADSPMLEVNLYVLSALISSHKIIIVDTNNDYDFSGESIFSFALDGKTESLPKEPYFEWEYSDGEVEKMTILFKVELTPDPITKEIDPNSFNLIYNEHRSGSFWLGSQKYNIKISPTPGHFFYDREFQMIIKQSGETFSVQENNIYHSSDTLKIDGQHFIVKQARLSGDALVMQKVN